jgi:hypothetical protein
VSDLPPLGILPNRLQIEVQTTGDPAVIEMLPSAAVEFGRSYPTTCLVAASRASPPSEPGKGRGQCPTAPAPVSHTVTARRYKPRRRYDSPRATPPRNQQVVTAGRAARP